MRLDEIKKILKAELISKSYDILKLNINIKRAYCADLMSDVLAFSHSNSLLITGLSNTQVIRTSEIADIKAIVFVQGKRPDIGAIGLADGKKIPLLVTDYSMFDTCGRLYEKGLRSQKDAGLDNE